MINLVGWSASGGGSTGLSAVRTRVAAVTATTPRLLLVDGHSLAYRAFFALPVENFSTTTGQPTNAVYGFTSMLINVLRDEQPTHIVVAFDVSRRSFRTDRYAEYKAGRSETPTDFKGQVSLVKEVLAALRDPGGGEGGLRGRRRHRHPGLPGPRRGHVGADLHRRPGRLPARRRAGHRALPAQGRLRPGPDGPGRGRGRSTASPRSATATWPRWSARPATTCPASPASARRPRPSGSTRTAGWRASSPAPTRSRARPATACASGWPT